MSSPDEWFKRWGKMKPFGPWWYADMDEMMKEMEREFMNLRDIEKQLPKDLVREKRDKDGHVTREIGPIVYGYSMTVGPDGKPVMREFGNIKPGTQKWRESLTDTREPLIDIVDGEKEVRVIAELPGVKKEDIEISGESNSLEISAQTATRKYYKRLELPGEVELEGARSNFNNGILEVTLSKRQGRSSSVHIKVE